MATYNPKITPHKVDDSILPYIKTELQNVSLAIGDGSRLTLSKQYSAPPKLNDGEIRYCDGTRWNAGNGAGLYQYDGSGWSRLNNANKNYTSNGNFDVWQRATSQTAVGYGSVDRWYFGRSGTTNSVSQQAFTVGQTDVPNEPKYFVRNTITSSAGAGNHAYMSQAVEGVRTMAGKKATFSFYAKADANKNIAVEFVQSFGSGGSPSAVVTAIGVTTCALTTSWKKFSVTATIPSISGKTMGTNFDDTFITNFWFEGGSDWNSRTNSLGQQSGTFDIAQVKLEEGSAATPWITQTRSEMILDCFRYYQKIDCSQDHRANGQFYNTTAARVYMPFMQHMRKAPTVTLTSPTWDAIGSGSVTFSTSNYSTAYVSTDAATWDAIGAAVAKTQFQGLSYTGIIELDAEI